MNNTWLISRNLDNEVSVSSQNEFISTILNIHDLSVEDSKIDIADIYEKMYDENNCIKKKLKNEDIFNRDILSKLDDTDVLPSNLRKIFEDFNMTTYFKIGVSKKLDSFFHSFMTIIDSSFYFNPIERRSFNINELKKKMLLDLSERNLLRTFNYSRKHWNMETFKKEFDNNHIITEKTINYFQNYFNINIIIYEFKLNNFWLSIDELFNYNREYILIIKYTDNDYEPVVCQSWINFSIAKDSEFLKSIKDIQKHLGYNTSNCKNINNTTTIDKQQKSPENSKTTEIDEDSDVNEDDKDTEEECDDIYNKVKDYKNYKKNYSMAFFNTYLLSELHTVADAIDVDKSRVLKDKKIKNKLKPELIKDILEKELNSTGFETLKSVLQEILLKRKN